jgi:hypothetical protein
VNTPANWAALKEWFGVAMETPPEQIEDVLRDAERQSPALAAELGPIESFASWDAAAPAWSCSPNAPTMNSTARWR